MLCGRFRVESGSMPRRRILRCVELFLPFLRGVPFSESGPRSHAAETSEAPSFKTQPPRRSYRQMEPLPIMNDTALGV